MNLVYHIAEGIIAAGMLALLVWLFIRSLKHSPDPERLIFKWILCAGIIIGEFFFVRGLFGKLSESDSGGMAANAGPAAVIAGSIAICGIIMSLIWTPHIAGWFARPITDLFDGGNQEIEPQPFYSISRALRGKGKYLEAVAAIRKQLDRFPTDLEGNMLLAETQAENLNDLPGAEITLHRWCSQPGHAPRNIAFALNTLADWHLKIAQDRDGAKLALEKIIELLPKSEFSALASQRIAHLGSTGHLLSPHDRQRFKAVPGIQDVGLLAGSQSLKPAETNPARLAVEYVKHLEQHPLDTEAREKLAVIYADHYQRLDMAAGELEQLISQPNQPAKRVVRWLNLLVDLQIKHSAGYEAVRATLQRIIDLFPDSPAAHEALRHMDRLKLELKGNEKSQAVKLGSYEQDIGLKGGLPH